MARRVLAILITGCVVLAGLNGLVWWSVHKAPLATPDPNSVRGRWKRASATQQDELRRIYNAVSQRADAPEIWRHSRAFAALSAPSQTLRRRLQQELQAVLEAEQAPRRTAVLRAVPEAQAYFVYQQLLRAAPTTVAELRALAAATPPPAEDQPPKTTGPSGPSDHEEAVDGLQGPQGPVP